jgi:fructokinase
MDRILCFGEVLWDLLPRGRFLGGAPLNVAYHLAQLGCASALISAVGRDKLGQEALATITAAGVDASAITQHPTLATGTAEVQLDTNGQARFQIKQPVAWDEIAVEAALGQPAPAAIVFGTLALRSPANRVALTRLLNAFPAARVVCDLNLRPPFDDLALVAPLLGRITLLKLNADEARRLCGRAATATDWREMSAELRERHHGATICITLGAEGAGLRDGSSWFSVVAPPVTVRDTVGAGDAFTAALVTGWLRAAGTQPDWPRILRAACALGGFVASQDGAQPAYGDYRVKW